MKFITDEEKDLNENDLLQTKSYADSLKKIIIDAPTPFNIGLYGEWGSGKSSIIKTVQNELEKEPTQKIKFVLYDAWKYANDSFRRMFLKTLQQELKFDGTEFFNSFYQNETKDQKIKQKFNWHYLGLILLFGCLAILATFIFSKDTSNTTTVVQSILMVLTALIAFFKNAFTDYKVTISKPMIFAPEQFEDAFNEMMSKTLKKYTKIEQMIEYFKKNNCEKNIDKLVIVVDNIDRCDKKTAYELLTNIKNFIGTKTGIIFLIPVDDEALKRHIQEHNKENAKEADEFLRKFFNVTLKIKHFQSRDLFMFANDINTKYELGFQPDTINIIAKEYASNPRRIIQLFNNLSSELQTIENKHGKEFTEKYQSLIAKLLVIREEWSDIFKIITANPHLLDNLNVLVQKLDPIKDDTSKTLPSSFKLFMERTRAIKAEPIEIEKIVLNITNHSTLSLEMIDALETNNVAELQTLIQDTNNYKKLVEYATAELEQEINRKTYSTGTHNAMMQLVRLNELKEFDIYFNNEINGILHTEGQLIPIMSNLQEEEWDSFYKFVDTNNKQEIHDLHNIIVQEYIECWGETKPSDFDSRPEIFTNGLDKFINNCSNEFSIKRLQPIFINYYNHYSDSPLYEVHWVNEDKLPFIISQQLIESLISKMGENIDITSREYLELQYFGEQKLLTIHSLDNLFIQIKPNLQKQYSGSSNQQEFKQNLIKDIFQNIVAMTHLLIFPKKTQYKSKNIIIFLTEIFTPKIVQFIENGIYNHQISFNLLADISAQEEYQRNLLNFYIEIYRITANSIDVQNYITALTNQYPPIKKELYKKLIILRDKTNYTLSPLFDYLISQKDIDENLFNLYEKLFSNQSRTPEEVEAIKAKLTGHIEVLISGENSEIALFIETMMKYSNIKTIIANIIILKQPSDIIKLPQSIKQLAYDDLCEKDKIFDIENEIEAIKDILSFSDKYNDCIIKIIIRKLQNNNEVGDAIKILSALINPSDENKADIKRELSKLKKHEEYGEEIKSLIKQFNQKRTSTE